MLLFTDTWRRESICKYLQYNEYVVHSNVSHTSSAFNAVRLNKIERTCIYNPLLIHVSSIVGFFFCLIIAEVYHTLSRIYCHLFICTMPRILFTNELDSEKATKTTTTPMLQAQQQCLLYDTNHNQFIGMRVRFLRKMPAIASYTSSLSLLAPAYPRFCYSWLHHHRLRHPQLQ